MKTVKEAREWLKTVSDDERLRLCADRGTAPAVLRALVDDSYWWVRAEVVSNPRTPRDVRYRLVDDPELQVRLAAAEAGLVDTAHANALARSEREENRIVAAFCSTLHPDLRDQLVKDSEKAVRLALVICEGTSNVQLLQLLSDVDPEIREKAMQRLSDRVAAELLTECRPMPTVSQSSP